MPYAVPRSSNSNAPDAQLGGCLSRSPLINAQHHTYCIYAGVCLSDLQSAAEGGRLNRNVSSRYALQIAIAASFVSKFEGVADESPFS